MIEWEELRKESRRFDRKLRDRWRSWMRRERWRHGDGNRWWFAQVLRTARQLESEQRAEQRGTISRQRAMARAEMRAGKWKALERMTILYPVCVRREFGDGNGSFITEDTEAE